MPGEIELKVYGLGSIGKVPEEVYVGLVVLLVAGSGFLLWKKGWREGFRASSVLLLAEWVFLILCTAVIFRESGESSRINLIPLSSYFDIAENSYLMEKVALNILNVALFIPVGLLLGFKVQGSKFKVLGQAKRQSRANERRRTKDDNDNVNPNGKVYGLRFTVYRVMAVGAGISVVIELLQLIFKRGLCEVDDVIHNVLGTLIGYGIITITLTLTFLRPFGNKRP